MADIAIMMAGCVSVPLYPTLTSESIKAILDHSDAKAIILGKLDTYDEQQKGISPSLIRISCSTYGINEKNTWEQITATHEPLADVHAWTTEELLTIIYTSGTTGKPKGVMHKAGTFGLVIEKVTSVIEIPPNPSMFSYLPLSHVAERLAVEMNIIYNCGTASFAESLDTFAANLASVQPHAFFAVPRIWAKFQEGILKKMPQHKLDRLMKIPVINTIIKKSIRKKLGLSRANILLSAAAPISLDLLLWFEKLGITIYQVYGMSEDSVYAHFNKRGENRFGSVGRPLEGLKVKFSEEGEICVKSAGNFAGYYKEPELTADTFDDEGYLKTGDKGEYDKDGYLYITGRIKDQFKTDKGKYISPAPIELRILGNKHIEQACVVGMGIPQPIVLITLSLIGKNSSKDELIEDLTRLLASVNNELENYETLEKIVVLKNDWTVENGLMTPTLKVKRNEVEKIFSPRYVEWFNKIDTVIWED
jgi:long-chain acyl-CoA synthetase